MQPRATPNGRASPYRGDPSPKPRVRSPARATKPWVRQPSIQRSPTGATLLNPGSQRRHKPQRPSKPQRGDPSPKPRVRSPARATKPWVRQPSIQRSPTGATLPNPGKPKHNAPHFTSTPLTFPRVLRPQSGAPTPPESVTRRSVGALVISSSGRGVEA